MLATHYKNSVLQYPISNIITIWKHAVDVDALAGVYKTHPPKPRRFMQDFRLMLSASLQSFEVKLSENDVSIWTMITPDQYVIRFMASLAVPMVTRYTNPVTLAPLQSTAYDGLQPKQASGLSTTIHSTTGKRRPDTRAIRTATSLVSVYITGTSLSHRYRSVLMCTSHKPTRRLS